MNAKEAMTQALEALDWYAECAMVSDKAADAASALRAALEQTDGPCPTCVALARTVMMDQMGTA